MAGRTLVVQSAQYMSEPSFYASTIPDCDAFRSVTIANQSSSTFAFVYLDGQTSGTPVLAIAPGSVVTFPIMPSRAVSFSFTVGAGAKADGAITIHVDSVPMSASGFQNYNTTTTLVWDQGAWDSPSWGA